VPLVPEHHVVKENMCSLGFKLEISMFTFPWAHIPTRLRITCDCMANVILLTTYFQILYLTL
jgi:hypothetical protein